MNGIVFNIKRYSVQDGPGIRTSIYFKGCWLDCRWCHNPESKDPAIYYFEQEQKLGNDIFKSVKSIGYETTVQKLIAEIEKDRVFYDESGGGVTISGGEPFMQPEFLAQLVNECNKQCYHIALDTSGFVPSELFRQIIPDVQLVLFDIKHTNAEKHKELTGVDNALIFENLYYLHQIQKRTIIRFPVIPNFNNDRENIESLKNLLTKIYSPAIRQIDLLPFHNMADNKFKKLNTINPLKGKPDMPKEDLISLKNEFEKIGYQVKIGG